MSFLFNHNNNNNNNKKVCSSLLKKMYSRICAFGNKGENYIINKKKNHFNPTTTDDLKF